MMPLVNTANEYMHTCYQILSLDKKGQSLSDKIMLLIIYSTYLQLFIQTHLTEFLQGSLDGMIFRLSKV